ncbi:hypothetical protein EYF80_051839 [Liparis tanakae]|uniref:Uncharacterized protein n=1 Tax=Liparis tanakae TaxID=230148 RepID=A0A4Z2FAU6_9TELE|nr:hypothetical protein EYF80_051839 [Liparis tanakae]
MVRQTDDSTTATTASAVRQREELAALPGVAQVTPAGGTQRVKGQRSKVEHRCVPLPVALIPVHRGSAGQSGHGWREEGEFKRMFVVGGAERRSARVEAPRYLWARARHHASGCGLAGVPSSLQPGRERRRSGGNGLLR